MLSSGPVTASPRLTRGLLNIASVALLAFVASQAHADSGVGEGDSESSTSAPKGSESILGEAAASNLESGATPRPDASINDDLRAALGIHRQSRAFLDVAAGFSLAGSADPLNDSWMDVPVFRLGAHYAWTTVDLGGYIGYVGSGRFDRSGTAERPLLGAQVVAALTFRWRFLDAPWGALFINADVGLAVLEHTEQAQRELQDVSDISTGSQWLVGALAGGGVGAMFELVAGVQVVLGVNALLGFADVSTDRRGGDYAVTSLAVMLGVEVGL